MKGYIEQFDVRGDNYATACVNWAKVRTEEVGHLIPASMGKIERACDVPAGTGIAGQRIVELYDCEVHAVEPTGMAKWLPDSFIWHETTQYLPDGFFDLTASLAGLHHLPNALALIAEMGRITKPGGILALADVQIDTAPAAFLREVVGGHDQAHFLDPDTLFHWIENTGFELLWSELRRCDWQFENEEMLSFLKMFFSLTAPMKELASQVRRLFGVEPGQNKLPWQLRYAYAVKR